MTFLMMLSVHTWTYNISAVFAQNFLENAGR